MKKRTIHGELMGKILKLRLLSCGAAGGCMVTGCMVTRGGTVTTARFGQQRISKD